MLRVASQARADWQAKFAALGFSFHSADGGYWNEDACYRFTAGEIDELEAATGELHRLALAAVRHIVAEGQYSRMAIPDGFHAYVGNSWLANEPTLYGRFDLAYDGRTPPKLLEYNADTPTSLLEAAVAQWQWLEDTGRPDQFNSLHEKLIERWQVVAQRLPDAAPIYFSCAEEIGRAHV